MFKRQWQEDAQQVSGQTGIYSEIMSQNYHNYGQQQQKAFQMSWAKMEAGLVDFYYKQIPGKKQVEEIEVN